MFALSTLLSASLLAAPMAELGGTIDVGGLGAPRPSPVPVSVQLWAGALPVATAHADLSGGYLITAPPGDYWLQIVVGGEEVRAERVTLLPGSFPQNWQTELWLPPSTPVLVRAGAMATAPRPEGGGS